MATEYILAWIVYALAGFGCCMVWWRMTSWIRHRGWRDLLRGVAIVLIFTPWYAGKEPGLYAPAIVVLLMDVLLEGTANGLQGAVALLFSTFLMLCVLSARLFMERFRD